MHTWISIDVEFKVIRRHQHRETKVNVNSRATEDQHSTVDIDRRRVQGQTTSPASQNQGQRRLQGHRRPPCTPGYRSTSSSRSYDVTSIAKPRSTSTPWPPQANIRPWISIRVEFKVRRRHQRRQIWVNVDFGATASHQQHLDIDRRRVQGQMT